VRIDKNLSSLLFNFVLEYALGRSKKIKYLNWIELNWSHQFRVCGDDVNTLDENTSTIKRNSDALLEASRKVGLEVKTEKT